MSRILIIEDEEAIADLEKDYLELSGFEVEICNRGDTGLTRALNEEFDLIILDLMLPEVDGFDICRQVRQEKNTPIIMVSAKKDDIDKIRGLGLGAVDSVEFNKAVIFVLFPSSDFFAEAVTAPMPVRRLAVIAAVMASDNTFFIFLIYLFPPFNLCFLVLDDFILVFLPFINNWK